MIRRTLWLSLAACFLASMANTKTVVAVQIPFNDDNFGITTYQPAATFSEPNWVFTDLVANSGDGLVATELSNSWPTVLYHKDAALESALGTRIKYRWRPGSDDDLAGFVLGFGGEGEELAAAQTPDPANFLVFDWKRVSQNFDFDDPAESTTPINNSTGDSDSLVGLRAGWVTGVPSSDELWGHESLPSLNPTLFPDTGGVTRVGTGVFHTTMENGMPVVSDVNGRATNLGSTGYNADVANQDYIVEIEYAADNVKVFIDGVKEFDFGPSDIPGGPASFPDGKFGFYEAYMDPGSVYSELDIRPLADPSAPDPAPFPTPNPGPFSLAPGVKAVKIDVITEGEPGGATWSVAASTGGDNTATIITSPNNGDVDFAYGAPADPLRVTLGFDAVEGAAPTVSEGITLASVAENGGRARTSGDPIFGTVEAPWDSGFGGPARYGLAIGEINDGGESTVSVSSSFFPYEDNWVGGVMSPGSTTVVGDQTLQSSNGMVAVTQLTLPDTLHYDDPDDDPDAGPLADQDGVYNVSVLGQSSQTDGLLFVVGASNESNLAAATPLADGTWNVAVRDAANPRYGGPTTFEDDDFSFLYVDIDETQNLNAASVQSDGTVSLQSGIFTITKLATGQYEVFSDDFGPGDGVLMLTSNESITLDDNGTPGDPSDDLIAPINYYATYEEDDLNDSFVIEIREKTDIAAGDSSTFPPLVDGAFSFMFVDFAGNLIAPEPTDLAGDFNDDGTVNLADYTVWRNNLGSTTANLPGDPSPAIVDASDYTTWKNNFGRSLSMEVGSIAGQVPEPSSTLLLLGLSLTVVAARRQYRN